MNAQTTARTAGPWELKYEYKQPQSGSDFYIQCDDGIILRGHALVRWSGEGHPDDSSKGFWSEDIPQANLRFIVQACNAHDDLVAALRGMLEVAAIANRSAPFNTTQNQFIAAARAALAKAGAL